MRHSLLKYNLERLHLLLHHESVKWDIWLETQRLNVKKKKSIKPIFPKYFLIRLFCPCISQDSHWESRK